MYTSDVNTPPNILRERFPEISDELKAEFCVQVNALVASFKGYPLNDQITFTRQVQKVGSMIDQLLGCKNVDANEPRYTYTYSHGVLSIKFAKGFWMIYNIIDFLQKEILPQRMQLIITVTPRPPIAECCICRSPIDPKTERLLLPCAHWLCKRCDNVIKPGLTLGFWCRKCNLEVEACLSSGLQNGPQNGPRRSPRRSPRRGAQRSPRRDAQRGPRRDAHRGPRRGAQRSPQRGPERVPERVPESVPASASLNVSSSNSPAPSTPGRQEGIPRGQTPS